MFLYLSKTLPLVIFPPGLTILLLLLAIVARNRKPRLAAALFVFAVTTLWLFSTDAVSEKFLHSLEVQYHEVLPDRAPSSDAIVVLGGYLRSPNRTHRTAELTESSDRLWMGARLFHAGRAPFILLTGGTVPFYGARAAPESVLAKALLHEWGVPLEAIAVETQSRNTYENAANSRPILQSRGAKRLLLVTSAFHMPRAAAIFRRQGLEVTPVPTDYLSGWQDEDLLLEWLPNADSMSRSCIASREWIGLLVYRVRGWA